MEDIYTKTARECQIPDKVFKAILGEVKRQQLDHEPEHRYGDEYVREFMMFEAALHYARKTVDMNDEDEREVVEPGGIFDDLLHVAESESFNNYHKAKVWVLDTLRKRYNIVPKPKRMKKSEKQKHH